MHSQIPLAEFERHVEGGEGGKKREKERQQKDGMDGRKHLLLPPPPI